jgi:hypothetical protein
LATKAVIYHKFKLECTILDIRNAMHANLQVQKRTQGKEEGRMPKF